MLQNVTKLTPYYRLSTQKQGRSGLGEADQRQVVAQYIAMQRALGVNVKIEQEFVEIESGKVLSGDRPKLKMAIATAKAQRSTLVIAKLDRVGRNAADILNLLNDTKIKVVFANSPNASSLENGIRAIFAEEEGKAISARTKAALARAKERGQKLGNPNCAQVLADYRAAHGNAAACAGVQKRTDEFANDTRTFIEPLIARGLSDLLIANALNEAGIDTRRGKRWHETTVRRLRARLAI